MVILILQICYQLYNNEVAYEVRRDRFGNPNMNGDVSTDLALAGLNSAWLLRHHEF